jgi:hypothetical protein
MDGMNFAIAHLYDAGRKGTSAFTVVPRPGTLSNSNVPRSCSTRSRILITLGLPISRSGWGRNFQEARRSIQQRSRHRPKGSKAISGAMCCGVSEHGEPTSRFSGNFTSPRRWDFGAQA